MRLDTAPSKNVETAQGILAAIRHDPVFFAENILGVDLWDMQKTVLRSMVFNRRVAVRSCHGAGKTFIAAVMAVWFLYSHPGCRVITTAPTWQQVKNLLWRDVRSLHHASKIPLGGTMLKERVDLGADWFAAGFSTKYANHFQGHHTRTGEILFIFDEAAGVPEEIYTGAEGSMSSPGARMLLIGNPTELSGSFYRAFRNPEWVRFKISAFDTPNVKAGRVLRPYLVTPEWVQERRSAWGETSPHWFSRVLAEFPQSGDDTLIHISWIEAAERRYVEAPPAEPVQLGVDVARFGSDESVISLRRGPVVEIYKTMSGADTMTVAGAVKNTMAETSAEVAKVDTVGVGAGVYDSLREQGVSVEEMNAGEAADDKERFLNIRAEWFWGLRDRFRDGGIALRPDETASGQLAALKYKFDSRGRVQIESKDEMKKRSQDSPDRADAIMLAFARPTSGKAWEGKAAWL